MFVQLCYELEKNPNTNKFIFRISDMNPRLNSIVNHLIDKKTNKIWTIYPSTYEMYSAFREILCPYYYVDVMQIDVDKFIGLTIDGYKIFTIAEWIEYIYHNSIQYVDNNMKSAEYSIEQFKNTYKNKSITEFIEFSRTLEFKSHLCQQSYLEKYKKLKSHIDVGFFDLFTIRNRDEYITNIGIKNNKKMFKKIDSNL